MIASLTSSPRPHAGFARLAALMAVAMAHVAHTAASPARHVAPASEQGLAGIWWAAQPTVRLRPVGGEDIPFSQDGQALYQKIRDSLASHALVDKAQQICMPQGTPRVMTTGYPLQIVETPGQVSLLFEENRIFRVVRLDVPHANPEVWDPSFMGESVGHREGKTLVIETTNFKPGTYLDASGLPHSDKLVVSERLSRLGRGNELEDLVTITDPVNYTRPWTARITYQLHPEVELKTDWVCGEPHRALPDGTSGAAK